MRTVGVRELKEHTSEVLRAVYGGGEEVSVTLRGREVARIVPVASAATREELTRFFKRMDRLGAKIAAVWPPGVSALDAIHDVRRDL